MSKTIIIPEGKTLSCNLGYKWHGPQELEPSKNHRLVYNSTYTDGTPVVFKEERSTMFCAEPELEVKEFYSELSPVFAPKVPLEQKERKEIRKRKPRKKAPSKVEPTEQEKDDE